MSDEVHKEDVDRFLDALAGDDMDTVCQFAVCPNCRAEYPFFHSPVGSIHTLCDECGWSSEEARGTP